MATQYTPSAPRPVQPPAPGERPRLMTVHAHPDDESSKGAATTALRDAARKLEKAVSSGLIKKNNAANKKSRMAARANAL